MAGCAVNPIRPAARHNTSLPAPWPGKIVVDAMTNNQLVTEDACRLSRMFNQASDLRTEQDIRINEWLKTLIMRAKLDEAIAQKDEERGMPLSAKEKLDNLSAALSLKEAEAVGDALDDDVSLLRTGLKIAKTTEKSLRQQLTAALATLAAPVATQAEVVGAVAALRRAITLIDSMRTNDPNEPVSDAGHIALDLWTDEADKLDILCKQLEQSTPDLSAPVTTQAETREAGIRAAQAVITKMAEDVRISAIQECIAVVEATVLEFTNRERALAALSALLTEGEAR